MKFSKESLKLSRQLFRNSFSHGRLDPSKVRATAQSIIEGKSRRYTDTLKAYHRLVRLELQKHHALVESAETLSGDVSDKIIQDLKRKYGQELTTEFRVNPELIGGVRIKVGNDVLDGTIKSRLTRLNQEFNQI